MAPAAITVTEEYAVPQFTKFKNELTVTNYNHGSGSSHTKQIIGEALKNRVDAIDQDTCEVGDEDAFFVVDMGEVYRQHLRWKKNLPRIKPHYGAYFTLQRPILNTYCCISCQM